MGNVRSHARHVCSHARIMQGTSVSRGFWLIDALYFFMVIVPVKWVSREIITDIISDHYLQSVHVSASAICTHPGIITKIIADRVDDKMSAQVT